jgi:hypothetical protein
MNIIDNYKQLQMIENIKKIKEMELCYKSNVKLCKKQEKQINKLATCIEKIKSYCIQNRYAGWVDTDGIIEIIKEVEDE